MWALVIEEAQKAGLPPWAFAEQCSAEWWQRLITYRNISGKVAKRNSKLNTWLQKKAKK